jgi:hypothetical protein
MSKASTQDKFVVLLTNPRTGEVCTMSEGIDLGPFGYATHGRSIGQLMEEDYVADAHKFTSQEAERELRHWEPYMEVEFIRV